ncbi:MAG: hypothetical protein Q8N67_05970, partial [Candidatus Omnitrophota bacterium]|nr:hypothetical protein [Candidatus Omnitrophota bacterium]
MKTWTAFIILFFAFTCGSFGQDETKDSPAAEIKAGAAETAPGNITMDFKDADISNVLRILSYKSGMN